MGAKTTGAGFVDFEPTKIVSSTSSSDMGFLVSLLCKKTPVVLLAFERIKNQVFKVSITCSYNRSPLSL